MLPAAPTIAPLSSDLMAALAHLEARHAVLDWHAAGVALWPLLRIRWMFAEWASHYAGEGSGAAAGVSAQHRLRQLISGPTQARSADRADSHGHDSGPVRRDIVFLSDGVSFARMDGLWVERFCDPIIAHARQRGLSCALWTPTKLFLRPRHTPSRFIQPMLDRANVRGALRARLLPGAIKFPGQAEVVTWLSAQGFGAGSLAVAKVCSDACRLHAIAHLYGRMLRRTRPRLAFVVGYYGLEGMAFVLACRRVGIPVVDIQHGVQGDMHPAYAAWPTPRQSGVHMLLPDRFWVWSDWERDVIDRWAGGTGHRAVVGGNPWMDVWHDGSRWPGVSASRDAARLLRRRAAGRPVVLVTLQYGLVDAEQLTPLAQLLREAGDRFAFWVRLHPAMLERRESIRTLLAAAGACELDGPTDLPLQALLPCADVHLTHSSSTVIEAAQFGVCSALTTNYGAELFGPLLASGIAWLETGDAPDLVSTLARLAAAGTRRAETAPPLGAALDRLLADAVPSVASRP
jgi:hypothetical protein